MNTENEQEVVRRLAGLQKQPARNPEMAAKGRAAFLEQAQSFANNRRESVSAAKKWHLIGWMHALRAFLIPTPKQHSPMTTLAILLILTLVFGGGGVTVAAAQNSLPEQALYPVKTWSENLRASFTADEQARLDLALEYAGRRAAEIQAMLAAGQVLPEDLPARYQNQLQTALTLAAGQPEPQAVASLARVHTQLQTQSQIFDGLQAPADSEAVLQHTRDMLRSLQKLCEAGLQDPAALRQHLRDQNQLPFPSTPAGQQRQQTGTMAPGSGNPWTSGTPTPGSGYGSGSNGNPWTTGTPTPGSGYSSGGTPGSGPGAGSNPWATGTPTPGSGYGGSEPGGGNEQPCSTCTPDPGRGPGAGNDSEQPAITETPAPGNDAGSGPGNGSSQPIATETTLPGNGIGPGGPGNGGKP